MGVFLFGSLLAGLLAGLVISAILGGLTTFLLVRLQSRRQYVIPIFFFVAGTVLTACIFGIRLFPFDWGRPGSNYDLAMSNLFWAALSYGASLGTAAGVAAIITLLIPTPARIPAPIFANSPLRRTEPPPLPTERVESPKPGVE